MIGRGDSWNAWLTIAGQRYLDQKSTNGGPLPRRANVSVTQQLVEDVVAAGGALRLKQHRWRTPGEVDFRTARQIGRYPREDPCRSAAPDHARLTGGDRTSAECRSRLVGDRVALVPVHVPERVGRYTLWRDDFESGPEHHVLPAPPRPQNMCRCRCLWRGRTGSARRRSGVRRELPRPCRDAPAA